MTQLYQKVELEYLPVYQPNAAEVADAKLFASNVRTVMASALGVPTSDLTFEEIKERYGKFYKKKEATKKSDWNVAGEDDDPEGEVVFGVGQQDGVHQATSTFWKITFDLSYFAYYFAYSTTKVTLVWVKDIYFETPSMWSMLLNHRKLPDATRICHNWLRLRLHQDQQLVACKKHFMNNFQGSYRCP